MRIHGINGESWRSRMFNIPIIVATWLLIGPQFPLTISILVVILGLIVTLHTRFSQKTAALFGVMGIMIIQSIVIVLIMHFRLWQPIPHPDLSGTAAGLGAELFGLDFRLAELGVPLAICVGAYIEFIRSRLNLAQAFPGLSFYKPPHDLVNAVARLAKNAGIECPSLCLMDSGTPSAFTVRTRGKYTIAVSIGLLESFSGSEVEACLAHEIGHIKNRDFPLRTLITMARVALFAKVLSYFVEAAVYRTRELLADRTAATLMGGPEPLISALEKLQYTNCTPEAQTTSGLCLWNAKKGVVELLRKHPSLVTRIRLLKEMRPKGSGKLGQFQRVQQD